MPKLWLSGVGTICAIAQYRASLFLILSQFISKYAATKVVSLGEFCIYYEFWFVSYKLWVSFLCCVTQFLPFVSFSQHFNFTQVVKISFYQFYTTLPKCCLTAPSVWLAMRREKSAEFKVLNKNSL